MINSLGKRKFNNYSEDIKTERKYIDINNIDWLIQCITENPMNANTVIIIINVMFKGHEENKYNTHNLRNNSIKLVSFEYTVNYNNKP